MPRVPGANLIFVDCEAFGGAPSVGGLTEFGAVHYLSRETFHGRIRKAQPRADNPAIPEPLGPLDPDQERAVFIAFRLWLKKVVPDQRPVMVSDNPAFDWQWINDGFWRVLGDNPMGFSARRIGDFYAGLRSDFGKANSWKHLRRTAHDHNPVNDAMGNVEAFERMLKGER